MLRRSGYRFAEKSMRHLYVADAETSPIRHGSVRPGSALTEPLSDTNRGLRLGLGAAAPVED